MEEKIVYFEEPGLVNTENALSLAIERAEARGIKKIILASTKGDTARLAANRLAHSDIKLVVIPFQYGFRQEQRFSLELVRELEQQGHRVHFGTMLFHTETLYGMATPNVMAMMLRLFSQGMKVCVEIIMMAVDGGCVAAGEQVIALAGTGGGSDTALVAHASSSRDLINLHIREIICKPYQCQQRMPPSIPTENRAMR